VSRGPNDTPGRARNCVSVHRITVPNGMEAYSACMPEETAMRRFAENSRPHPVAGVFSEIAATVSVAGMLLALFVL